MKLFAIFAAAASAIDLTTLALLQNGRNGFGQAGFQIDAINGASHWLMVGAFDWLESFEN